MSKPEKKKRCYKHKLDEVLVEMESINKEAASIADKMGVTDKELEDARSEHKRKTSKSGS